MRKTQSIKGEMVDFDLLEIKSRMSESPKSEGVVQRERFIDKKRRRSINRNIDEAQAKNRRYAESMLHAQKQRNDESPIPTNNVELVSEEVQDENQTSTITKGRRLKD